MIVRKLLDRSNELIESGLVNFGRAPFSLQPARFTSESCLSLIQLGTVPKLRLLKDRSIDKSEGIPRPEITGKGSDNPFLDKLRDQSFCNLEIDAGI